MRLLATLRGAILGWRAILLGRGDWAQHFSLGISGLVTALVVYLLVAFLALLYGAGGVGLGPLSIATGLFVFGLYIGALVISAYATRIALQWQRPILDIVVPGIYAMVVYLIIGSILSSFGPPMITIAMAILGIMLFKLGRIAGPWSVGVSAAFAVFTVALLVAMPFSLYMLTGPEITAV